MLSPDWIKKIKKALSIEEGVRIRPFLTTGDIVKIADVHPHTVALWRATGRIIKKDKIGSSFLYDTDEVISFLDLRSKGGLRKKRRKNKKK